MVHGDSHRRWGDEAIVRARRPPPPLRFRQASEPELREDRTPGSWRWWGRGRNRLGAVRTWQLGNTDSVDPSVCLAKTPGRVFSSDRPPWADRGFRVNHWVQHFRCHSSWTRKRVFPLCVRPPLSSGALAKEDAARKGGYRGDYEHAGIGSRSCSHRHSQCRTQ